MSLVPLKSIQPPTETVPVVFDCKKLLHDSKALDEALVESFPASDPVAVTVTRIAVDT